MAVFFPFSSKVFIQLGNMTGVLIFLSTCVEGKNIKPSTVFSVYTFGHKGEINLACCILMWCFGSLLWCYKVTIIVSYV